MKYKLLKDLPWIKAWEILSELQDTHPYSVQYKTVSWVFANAHADFFEPIVEKKRYEDLNQDDTVFVIWFYWDVVEETFSDMWMPRSETFLTREEAEDEHKRREWAVRPDRFIPEIWEEYFYPTQSWGSDKWNNQWYAWDYLVINSWLAFRTEEDCERAIKEHELIRLFYEIR